MKKNEAPGQDGLHLVLKSTEEVPFEVESPSAEADGGSDAASAESPESAWPAQGGHDDGDVPTAAVADAAAAAADKEAAAADKAAADEEVAAGKPRSVWRRLSTEDLPQISLREFLGGDYLLGSFLRNNIGFMLMLLVLGVLYITNRYAAQQEIIEEEALRRELVEKKNYALTQYARLTMNSRQSSIERRLCALGDSTLLAPKEPPFIIVKK